MHITEGALHISNYTPNNRNPSHYLRVAVAEPLQPSVHPSCIPSSPPFAINWYHMIIDMDIQSTEHHAMYIHNTEWKESIRGNRGPSRPAPAQGFQLPVRIVYNMPIHKTCSACSHCNITVTDDVHYGHKRWAQTWTARTASQTQMVNTAAQTLMLNTVAQAKIMSTAAQPQYWHLSMPSLTENHQTKNRQKWWYIIKQSCAYNLATNKRDLLQSGNSNTTHWYNRYIWKLENNHLSYAAPRPVFCGNPSSATRK